MKRQIAGAVLLALIAVTGCASRKPIVSKSVVSSSHGNAVFGTFVQQGEAKLNPDTPIEHLLALGDTVYVRTESNRVYALTPDLDIQYLRPIIPPAESLRPPVRIGDEVIFPSSIGLVVTNRRGDTLRTIRLTHPLSSDVRVDQRGLLLAGTASPTGGRVSMIDPTREVRPVDQEVLIGTVLSTPTAFQGIVYAATSDGRVFAIADENRTAWPLEGMSFETKRPINAALVVDDYGLYVASGDGTLYALDRTDGKIRWRYMAQVPLEKTPLVTRDRVYQVVPNAGLVAINKTDGKLYRDPLWTAAGVTEVVSVDNKHVYGVRDGKTLVALGINDGQEKFRVEGRFDFVTAVGSTIYAATSDGAVAKLVPGQFTGDAVVGAK